MLHVEHGESIYLMIRSSPGWRWGTDRERRRGPGLPPS